MESASTKKAPGLCSYKLPPGFGRLLVAAVLCLPAFATQAQVTYPLGSTGSMGLGNPNGDFAIAQDDISVKVPGGYLRINRDFDGTHWVFNRQWSGLGDPSFNQGSYASLGTFRSCTIIDGISSCDSTASAGVQVAARPVFTDITQTRVPNDPLFGRSADGSPLPDPANAQFVARKGVGFTRSTDGTSYVSSKHPRFLVRPRLVPALPASAGPDSHPGAGKPGQGGVSTTQVNGFRWTDRSGEWIEYDNFGRITSYGDRNDVRVWFQYGSHGQIERILDDNGRTVFTLIYSGSGSFITAARDHTPLDGSIRRVAYRYDSAGRLDQVTDARNYTTSYDYEAGGGENAYKISKVVDPEGRTLGIDYGQTGRIEKLVGPDGARTNIEYDYDKLKKEFSTIVRYPETATGRKTEVKRFDAEGRLVYSEVTGKTVMTTQGSRRSATYTDANNNSVSVSRDAFDQITRKTNADGTSTTLTYDSGSLDLKEVVDEAGVATSLAYDSKGNLTTLRAAAGKPEEQVTEYEVNVRGEAERVLRKGGANANGGTDPDVDVKLAYDANGNVREMVDGEGKYWKYEYDALGNMTRALDPLNHQWTYTYDSHGNRLTATDPNQLTSRFTYDATDRLTTITDPRGKVHRVEYDSAGRLKNVVDPTGSASTREYDNAGRLTGTSDSSGQRVKFGYDNLNRMTSLVDGEGNISGFDYSDVDGSDRGSALVSRINYPTVQYLLRYNNRQQLSKIAEVVDGVTRTTQIGYDPRGAIVSSADPYGKPQSIQYDPLGRPTRGADELGHAQALAYDHRGNLIRVTDELGHATQLQYDRRDKLVKETNALGKVTGYQYDDAGRLEQITRANGVKLNFEFDPGGRLTTRRSFRADGSLELTDTFSWDAGNRLAGWTTKNAASVRTYDDANRLLSETVTVDAVSMARQYTYHPNGQVKTFTGPDGITLTYTYDGTGALDRLDIPGEGSLSITGRIWTEASKTVLPGGTVQEVERDGLLKPTRMRTRSPGQAIVFDQTSTYGKRDELLSRTTQGLQVDYAYDDAMRLLEADPSSGPTETYQLDAANNRLNDHVVPGTWSYDAANRLTGRGNVTYAYDDAGNLIRKQDASVAEPRRTTHYAYDGYNRLVEVRDGADQVLSRYAYDPFGYRLSKEVTDTGAANTGATAGKRFFLQSGGGLLAELSSVGAVIQSYGWQADRPYSTAPLFLRSGPAYYYYQNDELGQPRQLLDKAGNVVWSASRVTAFGQVTIAAGSSIEQPWRLPGQYYDAETGLHYNLHRYYDTQTGRYVTEDPIGLAGGVNRYTYVYGSPTGFIDPTGEVPLLVIIPIVWGIIEIAGTLYDIYDVYSTLTDPCASDLDKALSVFGAGVGLFAPGGGYGAAGKGAARGVNNGVDSAGTETVQRWMSRAELDATEASGLLRGGREGTHYVTDAANSSAQRARQRSALDRTPEVRVTLEVPSGVFSSPTRVEPNFNMPGGGMERTATGRVPVRVVRVDGKP